MSAIQGRAKELIQSGNELRSAESHVMERCGFSKKQCRFGAVELWGLREFFLGGWLDIYYRWLMLDMDIGKIYNAMYGMYSHSSSYNYGSWKWVPRRFVSFTTASFPLSYLWADSGK